MEGNVRERLDRLRFRFEELREELSRIREEWLEACSQNDHGRESALVHRETAIFEEVNEIIKEFTSVIHVTGIA